MAAWPWSVLLVARASPMAIMAMPASGARPHMWQNDSPRSECRSRSLCDSHAVGRRRRRIDELVRAAGIKSLSPQRQFNRSWRPCSLSTSLNLYAKVRQQRTVFSRIAGRQTPTSNLQFRDINTYASGVNENLKSCENLHLGRSAARTRLPAGTLHAYFESRRVRFSGRQRSRSWPTTIFRMTSANG